MPTRGASSIGPTEVAPHGLSARRARWTRSCAVLPGWSASNRTGWLRDRESNPDFMVQSHVSYQLDDPAAACGCLRRFRDVHKDSLPPAQCHAAVDPVGGGGAIRGTTSRSAAARGVIEALRERR